MYVRFLDLVWFMRNICNFLEDHCSFRLNHLTWPRASGAMNTAEVQANKVMRDGRLIGARPQFSAKFIERAWCNSENMVCFVIWKEAPEHGLGTVQVATISVVILQTDIRGDCWWWVSRTPSSSGVGSMIFVRVTSPGSRWKKRRSKMVSGSVKLKRCKLSLETLFRRWP